MQGRGKERQEKWSFPTGVGSKHRELLATPLRTFSQDDPHISLTTTLMLRSANSRCQSSAGRGHHFAKMRQKSDKMTINKQWNIAHDRRWYYGMQCEIESVMLLCLKHVVMISWVGKKNVFSTLCSGQQPIKLEISPNTVIWLVETEFLAKMLERFFLTADWLPFYRCFSFLEYFDLSKNNIL